jgi:hypothetical protein
VALVIFTVDLVRAARRPVVPTLAPAVRT